MQLGLQKDSREELCIIVHLVNHGSGMPVSPDPLLESEGVAPPRIVCVGVSFEYNKPEIIAS